MMYRDFVAQPHGERAKLIKCSKKHQQPTQSEQIQAKVSSLL